MNFSFNKIIVITLKCYWITLYLTSKTPEVYRHGVNFNIEEAGFGNKNFSK
jgi:hypothetical protein